MTAEEKIRILQELLELEGKQGCEVSPIVVKDLEFGIELLEEGKIKMRSREVWSILSAS